LELIRPPLDLRMSAYEWWCGAAYATECAAATEIRKRGGQPMADPKPAQIDYRG
jgi:hypothetical protein